MKNPVVLGLSCLILSITLSLGAPAVAEESMSPPAAETRYGCPYPEARQFDFWIGDWNVVNRTLQEDGSWVVTGSATDRVYSILDGCAIVEHWRGSAFNDKVIGFSVRAYDPETEQWILVLSWPEKDSPKLSTLKGQFRHGRGEFFFSFPKADGGKVISRYSFSDSQADSMRWDAATSEDEGRSWLTNWIMEFSRRDPRTDLPLFNGPWVADGRPRHCGGVAEVAQLDYLFGAWQGTERRLEDDGTWTETPVRVTTMPILEGCAMVDFFEHVGDGPRFKRFALRSWMTGRKQWGQFELDNTNPKPRAVLGVQEGDAVVLTTPGDAAVRHRVTFTKTVGGVRREDAISEIGGTGWRTVQVLELTPTYYDQDEPPAAATEE